MRTANDALLPEEHVLLLKYAYVDLKVSYLRRFFQRFSAVYGELLPFPPLRHAVLALAAQDVSCPNNRNYHRHQAYLALITKTRSPEMIIETDFFAAFLLFLEIVVDGDGSRKNESIIHFKGCLSMLTTILQNSRCESLSSFGLIFTGIILHLLSISSNELDGVCRTQVYTIRKSLLGPKSWYPWLSQRYSELLLEAYEDGGQDLLILELYRNYGVLLILLQENAQSSERKSSLNVILQSVIRDLDEPEFLSAVRIFVESELGANEYLPLGRL